MSVRWPLAAVRAPRRTPRSSNRSIDQGTQSWRSAFLCVPMGTDQTLIIYEARSATIDKSSRRCFRWYWTLIGAFARYLMGRCSIPSQLTTNGRRSRSSNGLSFRISRWLDPSRRYHCSQKQYYRADDEPGPRHQTHRSCDRKTAPRSEPQHEVVAECTS